MSQKSRTQLLMSGLLYLLNLTVVENSIFDFTSDSFSPNLERQFCSFVLDSRRNPVVNALKGIYRHQ
jgi:hypothetical protein